jgi:two-component system, NtrC family, response regulator AtoC
MVDDEPLLRSLLSRAFARVDFDVVEAGSGAAALQLLCAERFDLVITDVQMPFMTGIELLRKLRQHQLELPVVLISGVFELGPEQSPADIGAFAVLSKPFPFEELHEVALRALGSRELALSSPAVCSSY